MRLGCSRLLIWETFFSRRAGGWVTSEEVILAWRENLTHEIPGEKLERGVVFDLVREFGVGRFYDVFIYLMELRRIVSTIWMPDAMLEYHDGTRKYIDG